jgi:hypothetical protein
VPLFQGAIGLPDLVEQEYPGDGNLQFAGCDEIRQLCEHAGIGGIAVASGFDAEFIDRGEVDDCVHALRRHAKLCDREFDVAAAEEVEEGMD